MFAQSWVTFRKQDYSLPDGRPARPNGGGDSGGGRRADSLQDYETAMHLHSAPRSGGFSGFARFVFVRGPRRAVTMRSPPLLSLRLCHV